MNRRRRRIRQRAKLREHLRRAKVYLWHGIPMGERQYAYTKQIEQQSVEDFNAQYMLTPPPMTRADFEREFCRLPENTPPPPNDWPEQLAAISRTRVS